MLQGIYPPGAPLPQQKELCGENGCSSKTLTEALRLLAKEGWLEKRGRAYFPAAPATAAARRGAVYITGNCDGLDGLDSRYALLLRGLEMELQRMGWGMPRFLRDASSGGPRPEDPGLAFVHIHDNDDPGPWLRFYRRFPRARVAYIDIRDLPENPLRGHPRALRIASDNLAAGREVGLRLVRDGHRHIAFLYFDRADRNWLLRRGAGLREAFPADARDRSLTEFGFFHPPDLRPDASLRRTQGGLEAVRDALLRSTPLHAQVVDGAYLPLMHRLYHIHELSTRLSPAFERALARPDITAWVCQNDNVAAVAKAFLARRRPEALGRLALAGFDNSGFAYDLNLASYDFQLERMAHLALRFLADPGRVPAGPDKTARVPGQLVLRDGAWARTAASAAPAATGVG